MRGDATAEQQVPSCSSQLASSEVTGDAVGDGVNGEKKNADASCLSDYGLPYRPHRDANTHAASGHEVHKLSHAAASRFTRKTWHKVYRMLPSSPLIQSTHRHE
jgi:hypothetical protein